MGLKQALSFESRLYPKCYGSSLNWPPVFQPGARFRLQRVLLLPERNDRGAEQHHGVGHFPSKADGASFSEACFVRSALASASARLAAAVSPDCLYSM